MDARPDPILEVEAVAARLKGAAKSETVRVKLAHLDDTCRHLVVKAERRLTVPGVLKAYAGRVSDPNLDIAEQSIRNRRDGANPYHELYRAWEIAAEGLLGARKRRVHEVPNGEIVSQDELNGIVDISLRHRVRLVVAQNRNLRSERDMLKRIRGAPVVTVMSSGDAEPAPHSHLGPSLGLSEAEVEAVRDFIDLRSMKGRGLRRATDDAIETADGRPLSDPGLAAVLEKIAGSSSSV